MSMPTTSHPRDMNHSQRPPARQPTSSTRHRLSVSAFRSSSWLRGDHYASPSISSVSPWPRVRKIQIPWVAAAISATMAAAAAFGSGRGDDRAADHQMIGTGRDRARGRHDALLVVHAGAGRPDAGADKGHARADERTQRRGFGARAHEAIDADIAGLRGALRDQFRHREVVSGRRQTRRRHRMSTPSRREFATGRAPPRPPSWSADRRERSEPSRRAGRRFPRLWQPYYRYHAA